MEIKRISKSIFLEIGLFSKTMFLFDFGRFVFVACMIDMNCLGGLTRPKMDGPRHIENTKIENP